MTEQITNQAGDRADTLAHEILETHCSCYGEAWPAHTCANEAAEVAAKIRAAGVSDYERGVRAGQIEGVTFAARYARTHSHHAGWLHFVNYRCDPLDQGLVDYVLSGVADSLKWWIDNPEKLAGIIKDRAARDAAKAPKPGDAIRFDLEIGGVKIPVKDATITPDTRLLATTFPLHGEITFTEIEPPDWLEQLCKETSRRQAAEREDAIKELLGQWVSELEPMIILDEFERVIGITQKI